MHDDMIILGRSFDLVDWLLRKTETFPRRYRFTLTQRITNITLDFNDTLILAQSTRKRERVKQLRLCDAKLTQLRAYMRLIHQWQWLNDGQYQHISLIIAEIGRMLGGWLKKETYR